MPRSCSSRGSGSTTMAARDQPLARALALVMVIAVARWPHPIAAAPGARWRPCGTSACIGCGHLLVLLEAGNAAAA